MEHESFENPEIARLMNETFVSIKVDREERPDIDRVYMQVSQMMTGGGGWPLTILMTPDKKPFYAASYIPKEDRYGQMGLLTLVPRIRELWASNRSNIDEVTTRVAESLSQTREAATHGALDVSSLKSAFDSLIRRFDKEKGGFGTAPKFPTPHIFMFLLRYWKRTGESVALHMVEKTLQEMRNGGIFDQIGFGFHRYSTDADWFVPHFEKMLYDQAMLMIAYSEAYQATREQAYARIVREIAEYLLRDMKSPEGGFYSAEDADSEGQEGKFYVWSMDEVKSSLGPEEARIVQNYFDVRAEGNFQDQSSDNSTRRNILHVTKPLGNYAAELGVTVDSLSATLDKVRGKMLSARAGRPRPQKDDKILADWNGLAVAALAIAGRVLDEEKYAQAAEQAMSFVLARMRNPEGLLLHRYRDGEAIIPGFLDDYAFLVWGLIELYETTFNPHHLEAARDLNAALLTRFWDSEKGGFFFSADDMEDGLSRQKDVYDGALPSGNSVSALNMVRLARLLGDQEQEDKASHIISIFAENVSQSYAGHAMMLAALDYLLGPSYEVVIAGTPRDDSSQNMIRSLRKHFMPNAVVILRGDEEQARRINELAPYTRFYDRMKNQTTAYVCIDRRCMPPTTDSLQMLTLLGIDPDSGRG
jgi:hypothetical protein